MEGLFALGKKSTRAKLNEEQQLHFGDSACRPHQGSVLGSGCDEGSSRTHPPVPVFRRCHTAGGIPGKLVVVSSLGAALGAVQIPQELLPLLVWAPGGASNIQWPFPGTSGVRATLGVGTL